MLATLFSLHDIAGDRLLLISWYWRDHGCTLVGKFRCVCILGDLAVLNSCFNGVALCVRSVPAAAGPVLSNGPARLLNPDAIKRELQRLQHVSKQAHFSRSVKQLPPNQQVKLQIWIETVRSCFKI